MALTSSKFHEVSNMKEYILKCRACGNIVRITTELLPCPYCNCKTLALQMVRRITTDRNVNKESTAITQNTYN